jgi:capping protein alpha
VAHYFEDGNVHARVSRNFSVAAPAHVEVAQYVTAAFELIGTAEGEVGSAVESAFKDLNDRQFKQLRRRLTVAQAKVDWLTLGAEIQFRRATQSH